ncbi:MAG: hypothetical protein EVA89_02430 [Sandaracinaceae bacterium]|nr:MAG: hypothetical protein EVA89_02430 [Sandaracinaceae bacterium]
MSAVGMPAGLGLFVAALATAAVACVGLVVQPLAVGLALRQGPRPVRAALLAAGAPGLVLSLSVALAIGVEISRPVPAREGLLDGLALAWPLGAIALWIALTWAALRVARR